jgi:hypothetical protein
MKAKYKLGTVVEVNLPETTGTSFLKIEEINLSENGVNYSGLIGGDSVSFGENLIVGAYRPVTIRKVGGTKSVTRGNRKGNSKKSLANGAAIANTEATDIAQQ